MKGRTRKKKLIFTGFGVFLLFLLAFAILFQRQFHTVVVRGDSMEPTLKPGQRLLFTNAYWLVGELRRQDIIVATDPEDPAQTVIKRIAGLAGDTIDPLNVPRSVSLQAGEYKVPDGHVYVLGDNYEVSEDSRVYGPIPVKDVLGKIVVLNGVNPSPPSRNAP